MSDTPSAQGDGLPRRRCAAAHVPASDELGSVFIPLKRAAVPRI
jgi:hypothetical protein